jgi:hypothetical protein
MKFCLIAHGAMKTLLINIDDDSSLKLFVELAKKLHYNTHILSEQQKEDAALLSIMMERSKDEPLPLKSAYTILRKVK